MKAGNIKMTSIHVMEVFIFLLLSVAVLSTELKQGKDDTHGNGGSELSLCKCKSGNETIALGCVDSEKGAVYDATLCVLSNGQEILLNQCLDKQNCLYRWYNKGEAECGSDCKEEKASEYRCVKRGNEDTAVDDHFCQYIPMPMPKSYLVYIGWSQCSRTCGEGVQYRQVECMRKFRDGTEMHASDCDINEVSDLIRPCHNQPCEFSKKEYMVVSPVYGRRRRARTSDDSPLPVIKTGTGNHWQPTKRQKVNALIGDRVSAIEGTRIYLKCVYGGKPEPKATWYIGDRRIDNDRYLPYRYSYRDYVTTLEIPNMKKYLSGSYGCRIENRYGVVKAYSEVRILKAGEATIFSQRKQVEFGPENKVVNITIGTNATVYDHTKVNIICPVQSYPFRLRVRWRVKGVRSTVGIRRFGYYGTDLQILRAGKWHSGTYICIGESSLGSDSESSTLTVVNRVAPRIVGSNRKIFGRADAYPFVNMTIGDALIAEDGAMIKISCPATGAPSPKITWLRRGVPIQLPMLNMFSQDDGRVLVIKSMRKEASDVYSCVASNVVNQVMVKSKIDVLPPGSFPPKVEQKTGSVFVTPTNQNQTVNIGQTAEVFEGRPLTIHCPAKGIPKPDISWKFEGKDVRYVTGVNMMIDKSGGGLMIVEVNKYIAGRISCTATNVLGSNSASTQIKILASSQPKIITTGSDVRTGKKSVGASVVIGNNLKTSGARKVKIICPVSGWPIPKVVWHMNGKPVKHPTSKLQFGTAKGSMLTIDSAREDDSGLYTCYAVNPAGVAVGSSRLKILSPGSPVITSGRGTEKILKKDDDIVIEIGTNMTTLLGNTLTMRCPFEGDSETRVQWTVDSQPVTFNKRVYMLADNALKIDDITFFDNGVYVCKVLNYNGYDTESSLLRISAPHNSILQASNRISKLESFNAEEDLHVVIGHNVTVTKGHNIFITCPIRGVVRPTIVWKKGSNEIKSGSRISVEGQQLLLTNVKKADSGTYYCFAKTPHGTSNSRTHLEVIVPTKPVIHKSSKTVHGEDVSKTKRIIIGDRLFAVKDLTIEIACRVAAGVPNPRISWYHNSVKIVSNGVYATIKENSDLLIAKLDESLQGIYKCVAENMEGRDEAFATIMIMLSIPPSIKKSSKHVIGDGLSNSIVSIQVGDALKASSGRDIMIDCEADGIPKPRVIWTKDNEDLSSSGRITIFKNGSLLLQKASEEDSGNFACTVINNRGVDMYSSRIKVMGQNTAMVVAEENEEKLEVNVSRTKVELSIGTNVTTLSGKSVKLLCPVTGEPKPRVFWYKDAIELEPSDKVALGVNGELILEDVGIEDAGRYTCMATNEHGRDKMSSMVDVVVQPEDLIEIPADNDKSDLRSNSIAKQVKMNIGMSGNILSRKTVVIECPTKGSIKPKLTWFLNGTEIKPNGMYKIEGRFLTMRNQPAGEYEYKCRAEMFLGTDEMESKISFIDPIAPVIKATKKHKVITDQKVKVDIGGNVKVKFGSQLDIRCPHAGVPTPEVSWFRNGAPLEEDDDFVIKGSGEVLRIPFVRMNDNATYICEVSNGIGRKAMGKIEVGVFKPERPAIKIDSVVEKRAELPDDSETVYPTIITKGGKTGSIGRNYSIISGMTLTLKCPVAGDPKPEIVWLRNGEVIAVNRETLVVNGTDAMDDGVYICKATNFFGVQMVSSHVNVMEQKKPVIQRDPAKGSKTEIVSAVSGKGSVDIDIGDDLRTLIGTEIVIRCPAIGVPPPKLSFYKDGKLLPQNDNFIFDYDHGVLTIKRAAVDYAGQYVCVAENSAGASRMATKIELLDPIPPKIQETISKPVYNYDVMKGKGYVKGSVGSDGVSGYPGSELSIECPVTGFPLPDIIWSRNGKRLSPEYDFVEIRNNGTLVLPHLTKAMEGIYECFAVNFGGGYARNITVTVVDPVSPRILKGSGVADMSQTLKASVTIGQDVLVLNGAQVFIKCPFSAVPKGVVIWSEEDGVNLADLGAIEVNDGKTLLISKATGKSSAVYQCIVSNIFGSDIAKTTVIVSDSLKPVITPVRENVIADLGANEVTIVIGGRLEAPAGILVSLSCPVSGSPRPNIKWFFNGKVVYETKMKSDSEAATYTISKLRLKDTGVYTCHAENVLGSHNASTHIQVGLRPSIQSLSRKNDVISAVMQDSVTVLVGSRAIVRTASSVLIKCFAHGNPTPTVKWYRDGNLLEYEKRYASYINGLLEIKSVTALDDGSYTCVAKNKFGSKKAVAHLVVVDPPRIASRKENRTEIKSAKHIIQATVGGSITVLRGVQLVISCPAKGTPEPEIHWKRLNAYHDIDPRVGLTVDKSLKITDITSQDAGTYTCIAKNKAGIDESTINVLVAEPPSAKLSSDQRANAPSVDAVNNIVVSNGKSVTIICSVKGKPLPLIRWYKEGKEIKIDGVKYYSQGDELYIKSATAQDGGTYGCVAENMAGRNTASFNLIVGDSPRIVKGTGNVFRSSPTTMKTVIGQSISIRQNSVLMILCEYSGTPSPLITWTKNGNEIDASLLAEGNKILLLRNVSFADAGNYTCMVKSELGVDKATSVLSVINPPRIKEPVGKHRKGYVFLNENKVKTINLIEGEVIKIVCIALGFPIPRVTWMKNMHELKKQTKYASWSEKRTILIKDKKIIGKVFAVLTLKAQLQDVLVGCKAYNSAGKASARAHLRVHNPPRSPYQGIWVSTESGQCNGDCVRDMFATQKLKVECRAYGGKLLSENQCNPETRPSTRKECQTIRCATTLLVGPWGSCSSSCGYNGFRSRTVKCVYKATSQVTNDTFCSHIAPRRPSTHEPCNRFKCQSEHCVDIDKYCHLVASLGYCRTDWSKKFCCKTCKLGTRS